VAKRTASAKKQARASVKRTIRNRSVKSAIKTRVVRARKALAERTEEAVELTGAAIASLDRAAEKGIVHPNNAARRKSRLMKALNAAAGALKKAEPKAAAKKAAPAAKKAAPATAKKAAPATAKKAAPAAKKPAPAAKQEKAPAKAKKA
jgi:ribosomal protein S20